jgi:predicted transcriptional regulator
MKAVLISIQPKWCELIASGQKTVEVRKTNPKLETPFKVYIYQTLKREDNGRTYSDGKVIGEFVCDKIVEFENDCYTPAFQETADLSCVGFEGIYDYLGTREYGYGWHITNLVIYDKPKKLREFWTIKCSNKNGCSDCYIKPNCIKHITRAPQSWCYVEELAEGGAE